MKKVKIYTTTTCPYCKMEEEFLKSKGISYEKVLVDQDPKAAEEMVNHSGQLGVPFTLVFGEDGKEIDKMLGFDKDRLSTALGIN